MHCSVYLTINASSKLFTNRERIDWGEDVEDGVGEFNFDPIDPHNTITLCFLSDDGENQQVSKTHVEADGTRVTVEYLTNEDGKKVKVTRKTRMRLVEAQVNHAVAERKVSGKPFSDCHCIENAYTERA